MRSPRRPLSTIEQAIPALIAAADLPESRFEAGLALAALPDVHALQIYLRGLTEKNTDLRQASATAIGNLRDQAAPVLDQLAVRNELPPSALPELRSIYAALKPVTSWHAAGTVPHRDACPASPPTNRSI